MRYFNNFDAFMKLVLSMKDGFGNTLMIFFFTLLFSLPLGLAVALLRMSRRKIISVPTSLYILVMRGTPLMLQIFAIYFAIPTLTGVNLDRMNATILAFSINYAAYFAEIFRGGIQSIPVGQHEASQVLGMTRGQTFFHIVLPLIVPIGGVIAILCAINSLKVFDIVKTMTEGGPYYATDVIGTFVYRQAFSSEMGMPRLGYASAAAILFGITVIVIGIVLNVAKAKLNSKSQI